MHWNDLVGFAAALAVLATFCMSTIVSLRSVAIVSNVLFLTYGAVGHIHPVLFLHATLLPINLIKLYQAVAMQRQPSRRTLKHEGPSRDSKIVHQSLTNMKLTERKISL